FSGFGTYYGVGFGSCGKKDTDDEMIVAVNQPQMHNGANPNTNPRCGKQVFIRGIHGSATARVEDTCPTCPSGNLDMSPTVFQKVCGDLDIGRCSIKWKFL
ncbi:RlpA-like double-psi beta-barrel-protein domain-containing protein-containing protein, partial [Radiomyces spectabilis]|uniref:RlpA-like double-psi beta-barrel-protein domain-containing protein-containing protein n=1 Tax=Radiomyces spectabilis TaxID=64574 RepID=UPI002220C3C7